MKNQRQITWRKLVLTQHLHSPGWPHRSQWINAIGKIQKIYSRKTRGLRWAVEIPRVNVSFKTLKYITELVWQKIIPEMDSELKIICLRWDCKTYGKVLTSYQSESVELKRPLIWPWAPLTSQRCSICQSTILAPCKAKTEIAEEVTF